MNERLVREFKEKLKTRGVIGPFMKTEDPAFVEAAGYAGLDFVILDMEHGPVHLAGMQGNVRAAQIAGILPIVRVRERSDVDISQALDIGAAGIQVPQITTAEQAEEVVRAAKYHPQGERGVCRFVRAAHYSAMAAVDYFAAANANTLVIIQLEGQEAIANLDAILQVPGVDIVFIGPYDLSQSLGMPGQVSHPRVVDQMREIVGRVEKAGIVTGTFVDTPEAMRMWRQAGVRYLSYSVDVGIFAEACAGLANALRSTNQPLADCASNEK